MRTQTNITTSKKPITFSEMGEFIQLYNRLDEPQKKKLAEYWKKAKHKLPITPQKVVSLDKKDYQEILDYARLLLITYCHK